MTSVEITPDILRQLLRYQPDDGGLIWLPRGRDWFQSDRCHRLWNARFSGKEAFTAVMRDGHRKGKVLGKDLLAHRVAWAIHHGSFPDRLIDHINGNPMDNRIANLRLATTAENTRNTLGNGRSYSGIRGVSWVKRDGIFVAKIISDKKLHNLGSFRRLEDAKAAYVRASLRLHGDYSPYARLPAPPSALSQEGRE